MMKKNSLLLACLLALLPALGFAQKIDERLLNALNSLSMKYSLEQETVVFKQPVGKRTQVVYIDSKTDIFDKFEVRQVYSTIHESETPISQAILQKLLIANGKKKIGAFELLVREGVYFVVFTAKIPPDLDAVNLKAVIDIVATSADNAEDTLFFADQW